MRSKFIALALGLALVVGGPAQMIVGATPAAAQGWHGGGFRGGFGGYGGFRGGYGGYRGGYYGHDGIGAGGVLLGLAAGAGIAAIATSGYHDRYYYGPGYYGSGYYPPAYDYGYRYPAYGYNDGSYSRVAVDRCADAAVADARGFSGYARFGHVDSVDRHGDDARVRGTVAIDDRGDTREVRFTCKFDDGRVRSLRVDRPGYAYNGY